MEIADEIGKLNKLKDDGALTQEEFDKAKADLLAKNSSTGAKIKGTVDDVATDTNMWGMFIHLAQFGGLMIPYGGLVIPIVLWQMKKDESRIIDLHGRIVTNWIISATIYGLVSFIFTFFLIGIPMLIALGVAMFVFPIIGGIKANSGEVWAYPLSIQFFKLDEADPRTAPQVTITPPAAPPAAAPEAPADEQK